MKNPLTLDAFADWLSRKPADLEYEFSSNACAIACYLRERGFPMKMLGTTKWADTDGNAHDLPPGFNEIAQAQPHTYGAASERAREALAAQ